MKLITPLNDQEINVLQQQLKIANAIDVSTLDGLFTALISGPELISPEKWLPMVFQQSSWDDSKVTDFKSTFALLVRHLNGIESILSRATEQFEPIFLERDLHDMTDTVVENWCRGYMQGINLCSEQWKEVSEELQNDLYPFMIFGSRSGKDILSANSREQILIWKQQIAPAARSIYRFWLERRPVAPELNKPYVKSTELPGRNDPCHCGSGKKYKRCCGVH